VTIFRDSGDTGRGPTIPGAFTPEGWNIIKKRLELLSENPKYATDATGLLVHLEHRPHSGVPPSLVKPEPVAAGPP
jgi:hypothetical protein